MLKVTAIQFTPSSGADEKTGLLGWICCTLDGAVHLGGLTLRRTRDQRVVLSFPRRGSDRHGRARFYVRPVDDEARRQIERDVFAALGLEVAP